MTKKMTKKEMFAMVIATIEATEVENREEMVNFLNHEVELLEKKSSKSGTTKTQKENLVLMEQLKEALGEMTEAVTISEFQAKSTHEVATLSNQKLSALLKKLVEEEKTVVKTVEKKKSYFALVREQGIGAKAPCPTFRKQVLRMTKEQEIQKNMKMLGISREEAEQLWEDDQNDFIGEEGEEMTRKAKEVKRYEKGDKPRAKAKKERKVDENKKLILDKLHKALETFVKITNVKTETEISFVYNDEEYTLKLTKHRPKKQSIDRLHKVAICFFVRFDQNGCFVVQDAQIQD